MQMQSLPKEWTKKQKRRNWIVALVPVIVLFVPSEMDIGLHQKIWNAQLVGIEHVPVWALLTVLGIVGAMLAVHRVSSARLMNWLRVYMSATALQYREDYYAQQKKPKTFWGKVWVYTQALILAPIVEELVFRALPLFGLTAGYLAGYGVALGQALWIVGHAQQVRPRTAVIRMVHLIPSSLVYLTIMLVVALITKNVFVAFAASVLTHFLHNLFCFIWPWYLTLKPLPASSRQIEGTVHDQDHAEG